MANIIIIDDDELICNMVCDFARNMNHQADFANSLKAGMEKLSANLYDVVLLDVGLPDGNGLKAMPKIHQTPGEPVIIIITGEGDPEGAEVAIKNGAWDYIEKPLSIVNLTLPLERALQFQKEKKTREPPVVINRQGIIGDSSQFNQCLNVVARAASCEANTLIIGETGTGKEQFANAIHINSPRRHKSFVVVDCAALPQTLVESTLFGHQKGAFTGADKAQEGLVKIADGGTLFLDEVGELPLHVQKSFLRVLQERRFRPVGGKKEVESDFRLIAATNKNLDTLVAEGTFREDLLFRLRSITISLPPLRDRGSDIKKLALHFMAEFCEKYQIGTKGFSPELLNICLKNYHWPGNVRELAAVVENLISAAGDSPVLYPEHLPMYLRAHVAKSGVKGNKPKGSDSFEDQGKSHVAVVSFRAYRTIVLEKSERQYLHRLMSITRWDIDKACQIAELSRPRLYALLKKYCLERPKA